MAELTVIGKGKAKPGCEAALERELRTNVRATHLEEGCLHYSLHRSLEDPSLFITIERCASKDVLDQHFATPRLQNLLKQAADLLVSSPVITVFEQLRVGQSPKDNF